MENQTSLFDGPNPTDEQPTVSGQVKNILFAAQDSFYKVMIVCLIHISQPTSP